MPSLFEGSDGARFQSWEGFANARSLEGIPTATGVVQSGRLFRSDLPSCSAEGFEAIVVQADLTLVLDLRSEDEVVQNPSVLTGHPVYQVTPLIDPTMDHLRDPSAERDLVDLYRGSIDRNGRTIAQAVRRIALAPDGGILIHCAAGKDRTGLLVAVLWRRWALPTNPSSPTTPPPRVDSTPTSPPSSPPSATRLDSHGSSNCSTHPPTPWQPFCSTCGTVTAAATSTSPPTA